MKLLKTIAIVSIIINQTANADTIKLKNGDVLTGTVIKKETDKLVFKTKYTGEIKITWADIASLSTDKPVTVMLANDASFTGEIKQSDEGRAKIKLSGLNTNADLDLKDLAYINPSPEVSGKGVAWSGYANLGGATSQGNTDNSQIRFDTEAIARTKQNRYTIGAYVNRAKADGESTAFNSKGYMQYDHFLTKQWYVYANGSLENDKFRDINLRSSAGIGSGYQFYEQENLNLSIEGGVNYISTDFKLAEDDRYASGRWALKYDQLVFQSVKFFHQHEVLVSLEDVANTLVFSKTGLRVPIANNLNASTQLNLDYANQPAQGRERMDRTLIFSLGYGW
ncbi:MAG: YdiY family protein [Methylotenera sp.]